MCFVIASFLSKLGNKKHTLSSFDNSTRSAMTSCSDFENKELIHISLIYKLPHILIYYEQEDTTSWTNRRRVHAHEARSLVALPLSRDTSRIHVLGVSGYFYSLVVEAVVSSKPSHIRRLILNFMIYDVERS
ncbi:unnamed protein product [Amoebophrya sp. A25]|nr:unnamed protein product [Amoebophrya sp. A25]|eukprot:GSA25T00026710001.1